MNIVAAPSVLRQLRESRDRSNCSARRIALVLHSIDSSQSRLSMRSCALHAVRTRPAAHREAAAPAGRSPCGSRRRPRRSAARARKRARAGSGSPPHPCVPPRLGGARASRKRAAMACVQLVGQPDIRARMHRATLAPVTVVDVARVLERRTSNGPRPRDAHRAVAPAGRFGRMAQYRCAITGARGVVHQARERNRQVSSAPPLQGTRSTSRMQRCATGSESDVSIATRASSCRKTACGRRGRQQSRVQAFLDEPRHPVPSIFVDEPSLDLVPERSKRA